MERQDERRESSVAVTVTLVSEEHFPLCQKAKK